MKLDSSDVAVIIPTLNAARDLAASLPILLAGVSPKAVWVIDSSSDDNTVQLCQQAGINVRVIDRAAFNHGATRRWARLQVDAPILVYMTQDAVPATTDAIAKLVESFADPAIAAAYGRQLPRPGSGPLEAFPRLFNYPAQSARKTRADLPTLGIKTFFCSNSFCAYRASAWDAAGGFPSRVLVWEDQFLAAQMILAGAAISYVSDAQVYHSHRYSLAQEFRRYFDTGAFLTSQAWMRQAAGSAESEGTRLLSAQTRYLIQVGQPWLIPYSLLAAGAKYAGYRLGHLQPLLPRAVTLRFTQQRHFWTSEQSTDD